MAQTEPSSLTISVVIPTHNRWQELDFCLEALARQASVRATEVIVVDDGSSLPIPPHLLAKYSQLPMRMVRQAQSGPAAARNRGLASARGDLVAFVDSDVEIHANYLQAVAAAATANPEAVAFQGQLLGGLGCVVHRMEHARLKAVQIVLDRGDGFTGYLNTSAFSVRRAYASCRSDFFPPTALRGEDSLVLALLAAESRLPYFVVGAPATHRPSGSFREYFLRHWRIGYQTAVSRQELAKVGGVLMSWSGRRRMLGQLLITRNEVGFCSILLVLAAYTLELIGRALGRVVMRWRGRGASLAT